MDLFAEECIPKIFLSAQFGDWFQLSPFLQLHPKKSHKLMAAGSQEWKFGNELSKKFLFKNTLVVG